MHVFEILLGISEVLPLCDGPGPTGGLKFVYFPIGSVLEVVQAEPPNQKQAGPRRITLVRYQCPARLTASRLPDHSQQQAGQLLFSGSLSHHTWYSLSSVGKCSLGGSTS